MPHSLNVFDFPLHGQRLIEASAGTGKTFTIAGLYLRLLLGHGVDGAAHQTPLLVENILVVTFTEAATAELRDRIRHRIHGARRAFERGEANEGDDIAAQLLVDIPDHKLAANTLLAAERQMDEASIYTIHGFCQRMLKQHAFESGSLFNSTLITDEQELRLQAAADFWRREFYQFDKSLSAVIKGYWNAPQALLKDINRHLSGPLVRILAKEMPADLPAFHQQNLAKISAVKQAWLAAGDLEALIARSGVDKRSYSARYLPTWLEEVSQWAASSTDDYNLAKNLARFSAATLAEKTKKGELPSHSVFSEIENLLAAELDFKQQLTAYAIREVRAILAREKQRFAWLSFDDLLANLADALAKDTEGKLAARIQELYPVAMIDEFQDTDQQQYQIFAKVYNNAPQRGLFLIGDPKQAIYAFRGADIFTYIAARRAVSDHYNLATNWRSSADMVAANNRLFATATKPFIYDQDIPFLEVNAAAASEHNHWQRAGSKQPALRIWQQNASELVGQADYLGCMAQAAAVDIRDILLESSQGEACLVRNGVARAILPRDIAVLVRTGEEARLIRSELAALGIASVYLSNRSSVFASPMAKELVRLLTAVLNPNNERTLRPVLASSLLALSAADIDALNNDESLWEQAVFEFSEYQAIWFEQGVLPMLRQFVFKRDIAKRLLANEQGERELTDLLHLGELLQKASMELDSHYALLRWLVEHIDKPNGDSALQQVRLESERDLVQIVTIHKSKGLEYNLVYLPFICKFKPAETLFYHDDANQAVLQLGKDEQALEYAEKERLAEDLRLLYVAVTRAVYGCVLGVAALKAKQGSSNTTVLHKSALGYLLQQGKECDANGLTAALAAFVAGQTNIALQPPPPFTAGKYSGVIPPAQPLAASVFSGEIRRDWRLTSYSALVKQGHSQEPELSSDSIKNDEDDVVQALPEPEHPEAEAAVAPYSSIFQFPRGARPGTFIHALFENVDFKQDFYQSKLEDMLVKQLRAENYPDQWLAVLQQLLTDVIACKLNDSGLTLGQIDSQQRLNELDFTLSITRFSAYSFNKLIQAQDPLAARAAKLNFYTVSGMLRGAIDMVFCWQGQYFVLDWKSNFLGENPADYNQAALEQAMIEHRYDFQYLIYTLALHRYLRHRIADYDYDRHIGGVYYLFVRGMQPNTDNGIFYTKPSATLIAQLDALCTGEEHYAG